MIELINIYTTDSKKKFKELENLRKGCWIDLIKPTNDEIKEVSENKYGFRFTYETYR